MTFIKWQVQNQRYLGKASQDDEESPTLEFEKEVVEDTLLPCHQKFIDCLKLINHQWHRIHWDAMMCMHEYVRLCRCKALLDRWRKTQEKEWPYTRYQTYDRSASNYKHLKRVELERVAFAMELLHRNAGYHPFCLEPEANIMQTKSPWPTLCVLLGSDQGTAHAVTLVQDLIIDSSQPQALPLTKDHLDDCCSTPLRKVTCVSLFQAHCFINRHMIHRRLFLKALHQVTAADLDDAA